MKYDPMPIIEDRDEKMDDTAVKNAEYTNSRLSKISFYVLLATVFLCPLIFFWTPYLSSDLAKTIVIYMGVIISSALLLIESAKKRNLILPPKSITWISVLLLISLLVSSLLSINTERALFGQGLETNTLGFIILVLLGAYGAMRLVYEQRDRSALLYIAIITSYSLFFLYHLLRIIFGPGFLTLGIFNNLSASPIGSWYNFGTYSLVVFIISLFALSILDTTRKMKITYSIFAVLSFVAAIIVMDSRLWAILSLVLLGTSFSLWFKTWRSNGSTPRAIVGSIHWLPTVAFILSVLLFYFGSSIVSSFVVNKLNVNYAELVLPWQVTLDVSASAIQNFPLFGVGPNTFAQAYQAYKPLEINSTAVWGTEFTSGFGYIPTFIASNGIVGSILWLLLFIFFGILSARVLLRLPQNTEQKFVLISSFVVTVFLISVSVISVPGHSVLFATAVFAGIFVGMAMDAGILQVNQYRSQGSLLGKMFLPINFLLIIIVILIGLFYISKTTALIYFGSGLKNITVNALPEKADQSFARALSFDNSDIYWRARTEAMLAKVQKLSATVNSSTEASTTEAVLKEITDTLNQGLEYANKAITADQRNYYNYLSAARVSEVATNLGMKDAYENALKYYSSSIVLNPLNPSLYLQLASLEARQGKYDDALRDLGRALQVKNNYLDAVFLLSQIYATKGDIVNAITAAKVATQLNPQNALLQFQLGLLNYSNKDYTGAVTALGEAVKIQSDYANAKYFLGLSLARLNKTVEAIAQFEDIAKTNSDNQEVAMIIATLKSGKSLFEEPKAIKTAPEKRPSLPVKERR